MILSKKLYDGFKRGDLTRHATGWRKADNRLAEGALDLLIELNWIRDVTFNNPNKRGRRSDGTFTVNPGVHVAFEDQADRIKHAREERYRAIQVAAAERKGSH
jgi:hypothetical protein